MKITVLTGSPHENGTSSLLADKFIEGAKAAGHDVFRFDAAFEKISPCLGCDRCGMGSNPCVQDDSMNKLNGELLSADLVVFVTPLYWFGMSAQIKTVIDRFYANSSRLRGSHKKAMLMATSADASDWTMKALTLHYTTVLKYLKWSDAGILLAMGVSKRSDIERTDYPKRAYKMGSDLNKEDKTRGWLR